jgi:superoxide reductase
MAAAAVPGVAGAVQAQQCYPSNIVYSADDPGKWEAKVGTHAPQVEVQGAAVSILTSHPMSTEHFIVRHTLVSEGGEVIGAATFTPDDMPLSEHTVPGPGSYYATSFCNQHDFWVTKFTV